MIKTLIVEDEYFVRKGFIASMPWAEFGIQIAGEASNGKKAVELLQQTKIDLLITDLAMPVMNGFDLMQHVQEAFPDVYIVVLTCHADFKYIQDAMRYGAIDYIVKTEIEDNNMQESLRRIIKRITESAAGNQKPGELARDAVGKWSEQDEKQLQALTDEWLPLHWVWNEDEFASLCSKLDETRLPLSKLQKMIHYLLVEWNRTLGTDMLHSWSQKAERMVSGEDWGSYIYELRHYIRQYLHNTQYPQDVIIRILQVPDELKLEMGSTMTQSFMARKMKLSRGYFSKCFKDITGKSFNEYLKELRIAQAKALLIQTAKPVAMIAEECGFLDPRYFSKQFREETGLLPSEYRNRHV
jgi:two-component system response regulator YesN